MQMMYIQIMMKKAIKDKFWEILRSMQFPLTMHKN